jgi:hypothetical protein
MGRKIDIKSQIDAVVTLDAVARKSGRAVFDSQGRASWEWQTSTGVFETNVSNEQLQRLEAPQLELVDTHATPAQGRVWEAVPARKPAGAPVARMTQSREYEGVLSKLFRRRGR